MSFLNRIVSAAQNIAQQGSGSGTGTDQNQARQEQSLLDGLVDMFKNDGPQNILNGFTSRGLGGIIQSWIGTGANSPISAEQITSALGPEKLRQLAQRAGLPEGRVAEYLRSLLPGMVDQATPQGVVEPGGEGEGPGEGPAQP